MANERLPWPLLRAILIGRAGAIQGSNTAVENEPPDMLDDWLLFDIGQRLDRINHLAEHPTEDVRLELEGYTETIRHRGWAVQLNAEPYDPWAVGMLSNPTADGSEFLGRLTGDAAAAIRAAVDSDDLSFPFDPNVYRWTTKLAHDAFGRTVTDDWGTADYGGAWTTTGGSASDFSVSTGTARHSLGTLGTARQSTLTGISAADVDVRFDVLNTVSLTGAGGELTIDLDARQVDTSNLYRLQLIYPVGGVVNLNLSKVVAGVTTGLVGPITVPGVGGTTRIRIRMLLQGTSIQAKAWDATTTEPSNWLISTTDTGVTAAGTVRIFSFLNASITNTLPVVIQYDEFAVTQSPGSDVFDFPFDVRLGGEVVTVSSISTTPASFVAVGAMSSADNAAVSPALYAGGAANDWIVCVARIREASNGVIAISDAAYSRVSSIDGLDEDSSLQVWVKVHTGSEVAPTVTPTGGAAGDTVSAFTFGLRNMPVTWDDIDDVVLAAPAYVNASAQNIAYPGNSVMREGAPIDGAVIIAIGGKDDDWTSVATLTGFTEMLDSSTTTGNDQGLVIDYVIQSTSAIIPDGSFTVTGGASAVSTGVMLAFAGGFQTMTVSERSTNGVVKSHAAGTLLEVDDPLILGL